jgi:hypothetical protein
VNVQVIADPTGRLIWASPALPGARHDGGAAAEHGIGKALADANITTVAPTPPTAALKPPCEFRSGGCVATGAPESSQPASSISQKAVNWAHSGLRALGERANAELKNWRILRKIRSRPAQTTILVNAIQTLIIKG